MARNNEEAPHPVRYSSSVSSRLQSEHTPVLASANVAGEIHRLHFLHRILLMPTTVT